MREREKKSAEEIYAEKKKISVEEKNKLDTMQQKLVDMLKFREEKNQEYSNQIAAGEIKIEQVQIKNNHIKHLKEE